MKGKERTGEENNDNSIFFMCSDWFESREEMNQRVIKAILFDSLQVALLTDQLSDLT